MYTACTQGQSEAFAKGEACCRVLIIGVDEVTGRAQAAIAKYAGEFFFYFDEKLDLLYVSETFVKSGWNISRSDSLLASRSGSLCRDGL